MFSWQGGSLAVLDEPRNQEAGTWISDTLLVLGAAPFRYPREAAAFIAPTLFHPKVSKLMFTGREHVFRSLNGGINPTFPYAEVKEHCNVWTGDGDINESGAYVPDVDVCDDWKAMGDPGHARPAHLRPGRAVPDRPRPRTGPGRSRARPRTRGVTDRSGGHISANEPAPSDKNVVWAATSGGRIFVTTNAAAADPATIVVDADRPELVGRPAAVSDGHLHRPVGPEPRVHHVQRVQPRDAGHAGSRLRGHVQPGDGRSDVHAPGRLGTARDRRSAGRNDRAGREEGHPLRRDGLRRDQACQRGNRLDFGRTAACRRRRFRS